VVAGEWPAICSPLSGSRTRTVPSPSPVTITGRPSSCATATASTPPGSLVTGRPIGAPVAVSHRRSVPPLPIVATAERPARTIVVTPMTPSSCPTGVRSASGIEAAGGWLVGPGARAAGITEVVVRGRTRDMPAAVAGLDVLLLPARHLHGKADNPLTVLEAMATGRPVVVK
jgi:glycosyltransferase involved in cell wall biosynthesis